MMNLNAQITGINYEICLKSKLKQIPFEEFNINESPTRCIIENKNFKIGISKWVSPKRTRSYPYARVYDTLQIPKRITVIPVIKDEGANGDRDFIQWDSISLMSLIDVYVILGYYNKAEKNPRKKNKITFQKFDNDYILDKIIEIQNYHSSSLHWNLKELKTEFPKIFEKAVVSYQNISKELNIPLHSFESLKNRLDLVQKNIDLFLNNSRILSEKAQKREIITDQPKEFLSSKSKSSITISNYLGGLYHLTVDEIIKKHNTIELIESKHTKSQILPSIDDIKDGLIKMILFSNLKSSSKIKYQAVLKLTSGKLIGNITNNFTQEELNNFINYNNLKDRFTDLIKLLSLEANRNNFKMIIKGNK